MKLYVINIGKPKRSELIALANDYQKRISHYMPIEHKIAKDENRALVYLEKVDVKIALDEAGKQLSSTELAHVIDKQMMSTVKSMAWVIGDQDGFSNVFKSQMTMQMSLSCMTFPYEFAMCIIFEQLYRAMTILRNEPYHRA